MPATLISRLNLLYQRSGLPAFLGWWLGELWALVPDRLKQRLHLLPDRLWIIQLDEHRFRWQLQTPESTQTLGELDLREDAAAPMARQWLEAQGDKDLQIWLQLLPAEVLRRPLKLPLAARENLRQVLRFEMDRHTPFQADQVVFDACVRQVDAAAALLDVELVLVPRQRLEALLERLRPWQLPLAGISVQGLEDCANLLPEDRQPQVDRSERRVNGLLLAVVGVLVFLLGFNAIEQREQTIRQLDEEIAQARQKAAVAARLRESLDAAVQSARWLHDRKRNHPLMLQALLELTEALPDDAWVQRMEYNKGVFKIQGVAVSANELLKKLDRLPHLKSPEIVGAITEDRLTHKEKFHIKLTPNFPLENNDAVAAGKG